MVTTSTPHAQWIVEAHVLDMAGALSQDRCEAVLGHLGSVALTMDREELLRVLGAMTDLATEFGYEIVLRDDAAHHALELIRNGRRMWAARPMPQDQTEIGDGRARGTARDLASLAIQARQVGGDLWDGNDVQRFHEDLADLENTSSRQERHQLALIDRSVYDYEHTLDAGQRVAPPRVAAGAALPRDACLEAIWHRFNSIAEAAASLRREDGTLERAWPSWTACSSSRVAVPVRALPVRDARTPGRRT